MSIRADAKDAGCWIDGHWGHYGIARMVEIAAAHGYGDEELIGLATRYLAGMGPNESDLTDDEYEILNDSTAVDDVEAWMNEHVAPEGFSFGWHDGEFFLWSDETWSDDAE